MTQMTPDETLLGLLAAQPQHGYLLLEHFRAADRLGHVWNLSTSQLYQVLKRLTQQGLVTCQQRPSTDGPARTEYELSESGRARLMAWLHDEQPSASVRRVRVEFLSRLYIARLLNIPTIPIVQRQKTVCRQQYEDLLAQRDFLPPGVGYLAQELVIAQLEAILRWLDRCELVPKDLDDLETDL